MNLSDKNGEVSSKSHRCHHFPVSVLLKKKKNMFRLPVVEDHLWMRTANERRRYDVTSSPIGWAHTQHDPWCVLIHNIAHNDVLFIAFCVVYFYACSLSWWLFCLFGFLMFPLSPKLRWVIMFGNSLTFLPLASLGLWVLSLPASVCPSIRLCVNH